MDISADPHTTHSVRFLLLLLVWMTGLFCMFNNTEKYPSVYTDRHRYTDRPKQVVVVRNLHHITLSLCYFFVICNSYDLKSGI